jgi:DNA-binding response OmpR family regulator
VHAEKLSLKKSVVAGERDRSMLYRFGAYTLDTDRCELHRASDRVELEPQVFSILGYLVQERSRIVRAATSLQRYGTDDSFRIPPLTAGSRRLAR